MAFSAVLDSVSKGGPPTLLEIGVTYLDDANPDWRVSKILPVTLDPALTGVQQAAAIRAAVIADASLYKRQLAVVAGLSALVGTAVVVP